MRRLLTVIITSLVLVACQDKGRLVEPKDGPGRLKLMQSEYNFGPLNNIDGIVMHEFVVVNEGSSSVAIADVHPYCHCTNVEYSKEPIKPGHGTKLKVYLNAREVDPGFFTRTIDVHASGGGNKVTIFLKGNKMN